MRVRKRTGKSHFTRNDRIREMNCNLKLIRGVTIFLVDRRVFQNLFHEHSEV